MDVTLIIKDGVISRFDTSLTTVSGAPHPLIGTKLEEGNMFLFSRLLNPGHSELELYFTYLDEILGMRPNRDVLSHDGSPSTH